MRHWAWIDEIVRWRRRRKDVKWVDDQVRQFAERCDDRERYENLVRDVAAVMGHRSSELADAFGGYLCTCENNSWLHLEEFGPLGGCTYGWKLARRALRNHHDFGRRSNLVRCTHDNVLCRRYGCPDDPEWKEDRA
jgi:hypothetical protein